MSSHLLCGYVTGPDEFQRPSALPFNSLLGPFFTQVHLEVACNSLVLYC